MQFISKLLNAGATHERDGSPLYVFSTAGRRMRITVVRGMLR